MHAPDFQTGIFAGLWGFISAASSVLGRMQDGHGRSSSLSIFESSIAATEYIMFESFARGDIMRRIGVNRFWPTFPVGIYETKRGWLGVTTVTPAQWRAFCEMLGLYDLRDDATLFMGIDRLQRIEEIEEQVHSEAEAAHRAGMVRRGAEAKNPDRAGAGYRRPDRRCREAVARRHRSDRDRRGERVYRGLHAAIDRHATAARRGRAGDRRGAARDSPFRRCCRRAPCRRRAVQSACLSKACA